MPLGISSPRIFDLRNRIVAVTGGLGKLGFQYTHALLDHGARVALLDTKILHDSVDDQATHNQMFIGCDVRDVESLHRALNSIKAYWGESPYALINNAAIDTPPIGPSPFGIFSEGNFNHVLDVNVKGVLNCCHVFGDEMAKVGAGSIVNVASIYGMVSPDQRIYEEGFTKPLAYSVSKSALYNMTRWLATYWAVKGVRVNTLTLGGVLNNQDESFVKGYSNRVPMGRMAKEDEYNGAIVFLVSDAASYMTGSNLVIDGGLTAW
jgi:NAD(P)-dependent dehydrogenase (short-subunit alcohol dehydrogenase family)